MNRVTRIEAHSVLLCNRLVKDIDDIRRENLVRLQDEVGGASVAALLLEMSHAQFANLRDGAKDSKSGKRRGMRKETARRIERLAYKPTGWLDTDHDQPSRAFSGVRDEGAIYNAWAAYSLAGPATRAAIDLLLLPARDRTALLAKADAGVALAVLALEAGAEEALKLRKSAA